MYKIVSCWHIGKYALLEIDRTIEDGNYNCYKIDGQVYEIVPVYDLPRSVAVVSDEDFTGKLLECCFCTCLDDKVKYKG